MRFLYVHIPFCRQKCNYCDFVSHCPAEGEIEEYIDLLLKEAELYKALKSEYGLVTVYFGGGNPGLLESKAYAKLLAGFKDIFGFAASMEITLEMNPEDVTEKKIRALKKLGVNRISIGAQAFQNDLLAAMGRRHNARAIEEAVMAAYNGGIKNISLDLIYGLPNQTMAQWQDSLKKAVSLPVTHVSTYGLKLHSSTPWGALLEKGELKLPEDDLNCDMQLYAMEYLDKKRFYRYEIANFAKMDYPCRHNTAYWLRRDYLGLGIGAASLLNNVRTRNENELHKYRDKVNKGIFPWDEREVLTPTEIREEEIMLPMRLVWGLNIGEFAEKYGSEYFAEKKGQMVKFFDLGLLTVEEGQLKLTDKGVLLNNEVLISLI
ncbi:MAG: radical SAM family heme chaperone HemW [Bacillota bacterium]|nr:radical SAM family heme chaperone HemW [Bacillota bacterium]